MSVVYEYKNNRKFNLFEYIYIENENCIVVLLKKIHHTHTLIYEKYRLYFCIFFSIICKLNQLYVFIHIYKFYL